MKKAVRYVGWPHLYEASNQHQFDVAIEQGLEPEHTLLDVGAGCLGAGRLFIKYLDEGNYWAIEPNEWLIRAADVRRSLFRYYTFDDFKLTRLKKKFDFILAHSMFTHADRAMIRTILAQARLSLKKMGVFAASFYDQRHGNSEHEGWMFPAGVSYTSEFIQQLAIDAGFVTEIKVDPRHPAGHTWLFGRLPR
jgi:cyclopropane fatty-acyl-phospholipid synthase-like methyltransferase